MTRCLCVENMLFRLVWDREFIPFENGYGALVLRSGSQYGVHVVTHRYFPVRLVADPSWSAVFVHELNRTWLNNTTDTSEVNSIIKQIQELPDAPHYTALRTEQQERQSARLRPNFETSTAQWYTVSA